MESLVDDLSQRDRYKLLVGCIVPRPIAFVSTVDSLGRTNLAPFSFFNGVGSDPMTVLFCPANRADGGEKDTLANCKPIEEGGTGEFVVCAAVVDYAREVAAAAEALPHGVSEFDLTGLATSPSHVVRAPRVARSPWAFECRTIQVVRTNPGAPSGGNIVIGRVVHVFVDDALVDDRFHVDADRLRAVGRMGGITYTKTRERYEMPIGREALERDDPSS